MLHQEEIERVNAVVSLISLLVYSGVLWLCCGHVIPNMVCDTCIIVPRPSLPPIFEYQQVVKSWKQERPEKEEACL